MEYQLLSKNGNRDINEDYADVFQINDKTIFVLADGLGGHGCGEVASKEAVNTVKQVFMKNSDDKTETLIYNSFVSAHTLLKKMQRELSDETLFKTTMVILVVAKDHVVWGHIGDSRIYHFEDNVLIERSMDHSVPQMLVNTGAIKEKQIRYHEDRNRLLKVLGADNENMKPYINTREPRSSKASFLLCTDGFWELIEEKYMQKTLKKADSCKTWLEAMESNVIKKGKKINMDNYSAIAVMM